AVTCSRASSTGHASRSASGRPPNEGVPCCGPERANQIASASGPKTRTQWFNTSAFVYPTPGTFGNESNGAVRGPGFVNFDFGLVKGFAILETRALDYERQTISTP